MTVEIINPALVQDAHKTALATEVLGDIPVKEMMNYVSPAGEEVTEYKYGYDVALRDEAGLPLVDEYGIKVVDPVKNFWFVREQIEDDCIQPTGYNILVKTWHNDALSERLKKSGLVDPYGRTDKDAEEKSWYESRIGLVLRMGPDVYRHRGRYQHGAWCEVGDFIQVQFHAKSLIKIHGKEKKFHYLFTTTDDKIMNVIKNPYKVVNEMNYT